MKGLIVTADDFGAAAEVNEAVETAHRNGILSAASLMVGAPAAADAIARARRLPSLRVGLHLVLVEGRPLLPAARLNQLVEPSGMLRADMTSLGAALACNGAARRQLAAEIEAQFAAFQCTGLLLDHCNAHKHFQLHPLVGKLIATIGARFGLRAVRVPLEPTAVLRTLEPRTRALPTALTNPFALGLRRRMRRAGLLTADRTFGLRWSGQMSAQRLGGLIRALPSGLNEIYLHPATGAFDGCAPGYRYREELAALTAPEVVTACGDPALRLGGFSDFCSREAVAGAAARGAMRSGSVLR
ncbi:MAG TPA: hopanoid biosynthesis-associated protein HpnK [Steroidobacteraceae bacterium]|nr:hopanoid biosynthesis-associated protein HpnK [Steroidobacteraceae bacterium]